MTSDINMLHFDSVVPGFTADTTKQVLQKLAEHTSNLIGSKQENIFKILMEQERAQGSGIGHGVAITHTRLPRLTLPLTIFAKLGKPVDFNSVDGELVYLVCLVMSPEHEGPQHLSRLAAVSRYLNDTDLCDQLRNAEDNAEIKLIVKQFNQRKMAA